MTVVWAWPLKRAVFARLTKVSTGDLEYMGSEKLLSTSDEPIQVSLYLPADPDRVCVYGTPVSFSRREFTGESRQAAFPQSVSVGQLETDRIEVRVRVYESGADFESVDRRLGDVCSAVATTVLAENFGQQIRMVLAGGTQDPTAVSPGPEPWTIGNAVLTFNAEVVTF